MHPVITIMHWGHHLREIMLTTKYHINDHLHSRHFWVGVTLGLLIVGIMTVLFILASNAPVIYPHGMRYVPY